MIPKLQHPFSMIIAGPSGCGKSTFTLNLLNNIEDIITPLIEKVVWCHAENNAIPESLKNKNNIEFYNGIPDNFDNRENKPMLIILDDLMMDAFNAKVCELFTKGSHHRHLSVILITQNIFHQGCYSRDISLNAKYMVIFKNPRDKSQFHHLARQIYPESSKELLRIYKEITQTPHAYLLIDLTQDINDLFRFRTDIFNPSYCTFYCPQNLLTIQNGVQNETVEGQPAYAVCSEKCKF